MSVSFSEVVNFLYLTLFLFPLIDILLLFVKIFHSRQIEPAFCERKDQLFFFAGRATTGTDCDSQTSRSYYFFPHISFIFWFVVFSPKNKKDSHDLEIEPLCMVICQIRQSLSFSTSLSPFLFSLHSKQKVWKQKQRKEIFHKKVIYLDVFFNKKRTFCLVRWAGYLYFDPALMPSKFCFCTRPHITAYVMGMEERVLLLFIR